MPSEGLGRREKYNWRGWSRKTPSAGVGRRETDGGGGHDREIPLEGVGKSEQRQIDAVSSLGENTPVGLTVLHLPYSLDGGFEVQGVAASCTACRSSGRHLATRLSLRLPLSLSICLSLSLSLTHTHTRRNPHTFSPQTLVNSLPLSRTRATQRRRSAAEKIWHI